MATALPAKAVENIAAGSAKPRRVSCRRRILCKCIVGDIDVAATIVEHVDGAVTTGVAIAYKQIVLNIDGVCTPTGGVQGARIAVRGEVIAKNVEFDDDLTI